MEINSLSSLSKENKFDKNNETKTKFLYKFKILNDSPKSNKFMGKCYLVNINSPLKKTFSVDKNKINLNKLPPIMIKENSNKILNTITLSENRDLKDSIHYKLNSDRGKKKLPIKNFVSYSTKRFNSFDKNIVNHKSLVTLTETNINDRKAAYEEIIRKINEKYFIKKSTVQYLTSLFFGSYETRDIKYINLSKIKGKGNFERELLNNRYDKMEKTNNNLFKNNLICQKKNNIYDNNKKKQSGLYRLNKSYIDERLKYYRDSRIRKVKNRVDHAINDLMRNRKNNLLFFDNMRKSCDYKYDDLGFVNYCD